ncbi:MAG: HupE/UreJ family protein [Hyphomicrobiaceae bacterium]|nr:HupE/UreJ family protein [Hyphomicrobiaceae bacterium]
MQLRIITMVGRLSALLLLQMLAPTLHAHEIRPTIVTITVSDRGAAEVRLAVNLEAIIAGIGPEHKDTNDAPEAVAYTALRALDPTQLQNSFDTVSARWLSQMSLTSGDAPIPLRITAIDIPPIGDPKRARITTVRFAGTEPAKSTRLRWSYGRDAGPNIVRMGRTGAPLIEAGWLASGATSPTIDIAANNPTSFVSMLIDYATLGFTHIVPKGLDHILFVLGLFFLRPAWRPLLAQVTTFTVAHSFTLALGLYGIVEVSPRIVEPLIALSIVYVAIENILTDRLQPWRPFVVFAFGLLHGLGFAGILQEVGLNSDSYVTALIGFNVGVEFGQLTVIAVAWLLTSRLFGSKTWYRSRISVPASLIIAAVGLYWTIDRIWLS